MPSEEITRNTTSYPGIPKLDTRYVYTITGLEVEASRVHPVKYEVAYPELLMQMDTPFVSDMYDSTFTVIVVV